MTWKKMNRPVGDFRDRDAIAAWARELPGDDWRYSHDQGQDHQAVDIA